MEQHLYISITPSVIISFLYYFLRVMPECTKVNEQSIKREINGPQCSPASLCLYGWRLGPEVWNTTSNPTIRLYTLHFSGCLQIV